MRQPQLQSLGSLGQAPAVIASLVCLALLGLLAPVFAQEDAPANGDVAKEEVAQEEAAADAEQPAEAEEDADHQQRVGRLVRVAAPLTDNIAQRAVRMARNAIETAKKKGQWPVVIFEIQPGRCSFGAAYDLADAITYLDGATTAAYVPKSKDGEPQTLSGHAVLVAMACDMILMSPDAKIGEAGAHEDRIGLPLRSGYVEIARRRRTIPEDLALGMLDPDLIVYEVETVQLVSREFVRADRLEEFKKQTTIVDPDPENPLIPRGEMGLFTGREAKRLGIVRYLVEDRHAVAKALGLPPDAVSEDPSLDGGWRAIRIPIDRELTANYCAQIQSKVQQQIDRQDTNLIVFEIDSPGGSPEEALELARYLSQDLDTGQRRTVAFIADEARGAAAFVALACDHIVMRREATLGGSVQVETPAPALGQPRQEKKDVLADLARELERIAEAKGRSQSLAAAFVDPNLTVYEYTRTTDGLVGYFSEAEIQSQPDPDNWRQGEAITELGTTLKLSGDEARRLGLASDLADDRDELKALYGLEGELVTVEPGWADTLLEALRDRKLLFALLVIGGAAFYAELQSPGTGVGGFVATLCFLLFFWGTYLDGTAGWLEALLFLLGIVFVLLEVFVLPGFGIFGIGGGLMVLAALVLALQTFHGMPTSSSDLRELQGSMLMVVGAGFGVVALIAGIRRWLPRSRAFSGIMLEPPEGAEGEQIRQGESLARYDHLIGEQGVSETPLTPAGKVRVGGQLYDVIGEGGFVERGASVVVVETHGNRIVVRTVD